MNGIDIDWSALRHAYGPADDVPALLHQLRFGDPDAQWNALGELFGNIHHQGTVYEATAYAVPALYDALHTTAHPATLLALLRSIARGTSYHAVHASMEPAAEVAAPAYQAKVAEETAWVEAAWAAVATGREQLVPFLAHADAEVRGQAATVLGAIGGPDELAALVASWEDEPDPQVARHQLEAAAALGCDDTILWRAAERWGQTLPALLLLADRGHEVRERQLAALLSNDAPWDHLDALLARESDPQAIARFLVPLLDRHGFGGRLDPYAEWFCATFRAAPDTVGSRLVRQALAGDRQAQEKLPLLLGHRACAWSSDLRPLMTTSDAALFICFVAQEPGSDALVLAALEQGRLVEETTNLLADRLPAALPVLVGLLPGLEPYDALPTALASIAAFGAAAAAHVEAIADCFERNPTATVITLTKIGAAPARLLAAMDSSGLRPHERAALALAVHGDAPLALEQFSAQEIGSAGWWGIVARSTLQDHATLAVSTLERVRAHWGRVDAATYLLRHPAERATALAALEEAALDGYVHALHTLVAHDHGTPVLAAWLAAQLTSPTRVSYRTAWEDDDLLAVWARAFRSLFPEEPVPERR